MRGALRRARARAPAKSAEERAQDKAEKKAERERLRRENAERRRVHPAHPAPLPERVCDGVPVSEDLLAGCWSALQKRSQDWDQDALPGRRARQKEEDRARRAQELALRKRESGASAGAAPAGVAAVQ